MSRYSAILTHIPRRGCTLHTWKLKRYTGALVYEYCKHCDARRVCSVDGAGYQPINRAWVLHEREFLG